MSQKILPKSLTAEEFKKLVLATPKRDKSALTSFILAYGSGLRIQEVVNLQKSDIRKDVSPPIISIRQGKGGKDRTVPLPKGWKDWMLSQIPIKKTMRSLERNFKSSVKKARLNPHYTFHSLRHGFAVRLVESGVPLPHVQMLLGHSNLSTTNIYTRSRPMDALKSYEDLF